MEIVVRGRNVEVPEHFRQRVWDKVSTSDRFDGKLKINRIDVELFHEKNPRQAGNCQRVEITLSGKGPVVRAEASGPDFYAALDLAVGKLENRLRRAADRRRVHHGRRTPASVRMTDNTSSEMGAIDAIDLDRQLAEGSHVTDLDEHLPGRVVREKHHPAVPMTVDQALHEMELVGHDFFLFQCAETGQPTVVYRRHAYDYGLIRLTEVAQNGIGPAHTAKPAAAQEAAAPV
jgi:ribosomal subunit interface protein